MTISIVFILPNAPLALTYTRKILFHMLLQNALFLAAMFCISLLIIIISKNLLRLPAHSKEGRLRNHYSAT